MKKVTYKGPVDKSDKSSTLFAEGERFDVGVEVEVSDAAAERLDKLEGHTFSIKAGPKRSGGS